MLGTQAPVVCLLLHQDNPDFSLYMHMPYVQIMTICSNSQHSRWKDPASAPIINHKKTQWRRKLFALLISLMSSLHELSNIFSSPFTIFSKNISVSDNDNNQDMPLSSAELLRNSNKNCLSYKIVKISSSNIVWWLCNVLNMLQLIRQTLLLLSTGFSHVGIAHTNNR